MNPKPKIFSSPRLFQVSTSHPVNPNRPPIEYCRGNIVGFSPKARRNLAKYIATLVVPPVGIHLTCTYGKKYPKNSSDYKTDLDKFKKRLIRLGLFGIWVLEFQERGAPHFHLLLFPTDNESWELGEFAARAWREVSGNTSNSAAFVSNGATGRSTFYLALHSTKGNQSPPWRVGRWWGKIDTKHLKSVEFTEDLAECENDRELVWLKRIFIRHANAQRRKRGNFKKFKSNNWCGAREKQKGFTWFIPTSHPTHKNKKYNDSNFHMRIALLVGDIVEDEKKDEII
jgi:hypothetical protein